MSERREKLYHAKAAKLLAKERRGVLCLLYV